MLDRRQFASLVASGVASRLIAGAGGLATALVARRAWGQSASLPFGNGDRQLVQYPQKRPLIRLTERPPQLETPFDVFDAGPISYTHLRAHETPEHLVCRLLLEK